MVNVKIGRMGYQIENERIMSWFENGLQFYKSLRIKYNPSGSNTYRMVDLLGDINESRKYSNFHVPPFMTWIYTEDNGSNYQSFIDFSIHADSGSFTTCPLIAVRNFDSSIIYSCVVYPNRISKWGKN